MTIDCLARGTSEALLYAINFVFSFSTEALPERKKGRKKKKKGRKAQVRLPIFQQSLLLRINQTGKPWFQFEKELSKKARN